MNLFIITSVVHINRSIGWTYTSIRSYYSDEERYSDTLKTIESIRRHVKNSKIVLLEGSRLSETEEAGFKQNVDYFIDYSNDPLIHEKVNTNKKGQGEVWKLIKFLTENRELINNFLRIFKISGRYWLSDVFNLNNFSFEKDTALKCSAVGVSTVLYSIVSKNLDNYIGTLVKIAEYLEVESKSIEDLFLFFHKDFYFIDKLGVEGWVAVSKNELYKV